MISEPQVDVHTKNLSSFLIDFKKVRIKIIKKIGQGKLSYVYLGIDVANKKSHTVKQISLDDELRNITLINELNIFKNMPKCEYFVEYFGDISFDNFRFVLLEFCPISLLDYIQNRNGALFFHDDIVRILGQLVIIVEKMHSLNPVVISLDLKVESFMICNSGMLKLGSFGWGNRQKIDPSKMDHGEKCKFEKDIYNSTSSMYRAPEMLDLYLNYVIDEKSDIWSLGCIFYYVCTFDFPFNPDNRLSILRVEYDKIKNENIFLSDLINSLISKIFKILPSARPSALAISREIQQYAEKAGVQINLPVINIYLLDDKKGFGKYMSMTNVFLKAGNIFDRIKEKSAKFKEQMQPVQKRGDKNYCNFLTGKLAITLNQANLDPSFPQFIAEYLNSKFSSIYLFINLQNLENFPIQYFNNRVLTYDMDENQAPMLDKILDIVVNILKYTAYDSKRVIVLNDNQSGYLSLFLITILLIYSRVFQNFEQYFEKIILSRSNIVVSPAHCSFVRFGHYIEVISNNPGFNLSKSVLYLRSLIFYPVLFVNRKSNGCRPFVTVEIDENIVFSSLSNPRNTKAFTENDKLVEIPINIYLYGNIRILFYHITSKNGKYYQRKLFGFQFHTAFLKPNNTFLINGHELDIFDFRYLTSILKIRIELKIESKLENKFSNLDMKDNIINTSSSLIFFNNQNEYTNFMQSIDQISNVNFFDLKFKRILTKESEETKESIYLIEKNSKIVDFDSSNLQKSTLINPDMSQSYPKPLIHLNYSETTGISENIQSSTVTPNIDSTPTPENSNFDFIHSPSKSNDSWKLLTESNQMSVKMDHTNINDEIFSQQLNQNLQTKSIEVDDLLFTSHNINVNNSPRQLNPDFGSLDSLLVNQKMNQTNLKYSSSQYKNNSDEMRSNSSKSSRSMSSTQEKPKNIFKSTDPNDIFGDILFQQGFGNPPTTSSYKLSLDESKKLQQEIIDRDPTLKAVHKWACGKNKNIKLLLTTFASIIWCPETWKSISMNDLKDYESVKKAYRKACLLVHPDKLSGSSHEELAKAIFCELTEAWNLFDSKKGKIF